MRMNTLGEAAVRAAKDILKRCDSCTICTKECPLLKERGMPHELARDALVGRLDPAMPFLCSLCGLCSVACPRKADPSGFMRLLRAEYIASGAYPLEPFAAYLENETRLLSRNHTFLAAPPGARRGFLPGCGLSGSRPETAWKTYEMLDATEPTAFLLACCSRPSENAGLHSVAAGRVRGLVDRIAALGLEEVLTPCPGCREMIRSVEPPFAVNTVYEALAPEADEREQDPDKESLDIAVQDSCLWRLDKAVHRAVRDLVWGSGHAVSEMNHAWYRTTCCGAGGRADLAGSPLPESWRAQRLEEAGERPIATACTGCARTLGASHPTVHVLDLYLGADPLHPPVLLQGRRAHAARLELKRRARRHFRKLLQDA
jgi:Fe-S oxidoreductase